MRKKEPYGLMMLLFTPFTATRFAMHRIYANRINSRGMSRVFCDLRSQKTRDIQAKIPLPQAIWNFGCVTENGVNSNDLSDTRSKAGKLFFAGKNKAFDLFIIYMITYTNKIDKNTKVLYNRYKRKQN